MFTLFKNSTKVQLNQTNIIAYALAFVVLWFGLSELFAPKDWVGFAPVFLGEGTLALALVVVHGITLSLCGLMLISNFYRRVAAAVLVIIFTEIVIDLIIGGIATDIVVRDIGLWGMAVALVIKE